MSGQRKRHSFLETVANTVSGFVLSFLVNLFLFPVLGIHMASGPAFAVTAVLTGVSIARGYFWRRFFNWLYTREYLR